MGHSAGTLEDISPGKRNLETSNNRDPLCEILIGTWILSSARLEANHIIFWPKKQLKSHSVHVFKHLTEVQCKTNGLTLLENEISRKDDIQSSSEEATIIKRKL